MDKVTAAAIIVAGVIVVLKQFGLIPEPRSTGYWRERAEAAEEALGEVTDERDELAATRTLEPILELLAHNSEQQSQVLDRLARHNGSFRHMEESMGLIHESLKTLTGFITSLADIPIRPPN